MEKNFFLSYEPEGDLLEVVFDESLHRSEQRAFRLRDGFILFTTIDTRIPVQLTVVNFSKLTQLPAIPFDGWKKIKASDKEKLLPILNSLPVCNFLKLDPKTGYGHLSNPGVVEVFAAAA